MWWVFLDRKHYIIHPNLILISSSKLCPHLPVSAPWQRLAAQVATCHHSQGDIPPQEWPKNVLLCLSCSSMASPADFLTNLWTPVWELFVTDVRSVFLIYHGCTHHVPFALPSRVQSVFWGPTSTSSHPADSWRQIWSSHSLCRQALLTFHCEFSHQCATCSTGRIVLQPFRTEQLPAKRVGNACTSFPSKCVYSLLYSLNSTEAIIFSLPS